MITVLQDDFSQFSIGPFPYDPQHSAIGEYHYYPSAGNHGDWHDPMVYSRWRGPTWIITENRGTKYMEQTRPQFAIKPAFWPLLVKGDVSWRDYTLEITLRPLSTLTHTGIVFRYQHARRYYFLGFEGGKLLLLKRDQERITELASAAFQYDVDHRYRLKITCSGSKLQASVNGEALLQAEDGSYANGRIGLSSRMPAQYSDVVVSMAEKDHRGWIASVKANALELAQLRSEYAQPRLWKTVDFKNFGTSRQIRFGHLTGSKELQMVLAQHQKRGQGDAYAHISCLTAITLDGEVLWQLGEASTLEDHILLSADLPFQVCDVDGDGYDEVVMARNFELMILDGRTGYVKRSIPTPMSVESTKELYHVPHGQFAFDRVNVDSIRIANFSGKATATDIIIKDRYSRLWVYNSELELLWTFHEGVTGHFPYTVDMDGDGKDEMFVGYHWVDHDGTLLWTLPVPTDHTDEILLGSWNPNTPEPLIAIASGDEGFMIANLQGEILQKHMIGHVQRVSIGNYRPDLPGLELCVSTFWGEQGIVYIYDSQGRLLHQFEPGCNGNVITPVSWAGDGSDLVLLNGNTKFGGLIDGSGRRVVVFPEDGHPDLCSEVLDVTGDGRDEILLWDAQRMYIYTQDRPAATDKVLVPDKYPHFNASNYRGEFNYPRKA
ncbi:hypothetical protein [Paenibacillus piri]|uniref:VCBS repeat-containing protein n=1 Tax=Paenibacillus piri TaxID=2547395 RepID=A0A4R5KL28_9BACL|nr:hypothetical protein [Paenibacillus piri]TDF96273.1 hypothetical protein E1757_17965 [Paenibacillus piri]